ncbi:hypothetical protein [Syntrophotalea acetylenica]|uniref:Uncharacterized protein n=1 Tax=Syntrophotalea acetylenica TaxID=29542 RepID=A0A1L3GDT2_SYNAC|nr:hypothetical protein [Syntrophotalea acetylenica]APG24067.1 hypothetical protein A7E75_02765 [Syntrophotalea acetylenica]APG44649.1 hypothetical protein A6070_11390 [Syntrophotalea acetylenica]APG45449.1 hypothetical protein A6070_14815 [Syntrophotalea acetylenica]
MATTLTISNEEDAWEFLKESVTDGLTKGLVEIEFDGWPVLEFKLQGDKFNSSLTVKVMESFIDLQKNLNRTYAQMRYNKSTARALSEAERNELEIVVKVEKGSSFFQVDLQSALETFANGAVTKMTGTEIVSVVLGGALIWGGVTITKAYLDHVRQKKQIEMTSLLSEQETKRMQIFADAMQKNPVLVPAYERAEDTINKLLKGASEADHLEIGGHSISQDVVRELVRQTRTRSIKTQLNGMYRIQKVDSSKPEAFYIGVKSEKDGRIFTATLEDKWVFRKAAHLKELKDAEWGKSPIFLRINGKEIDGQVTQAMIVDVGEDKE